MRKRVVRGGGAATNPAAAPGPDVHVDLRDLEGLDDDGIGARIARNEQDLQRLRAEFFGFKPGEPATSEASPQDGTTQSRELAWFNSQEAKEVGFQVGRSIGMGLLELSRGILDLGAERVAAARLRVEARALEDQQRRDRDAIAAASTPPPSTPTTAPPASPPANQDLEVEPVGPGTAVDLLPTQPYLGPGAVRVIRRPADPADREDA